MAAGNSPGVGYTVVVKGVEIRCETLEALNALLQHHFFDAAEVQPAQVARRSARVAHKRCRRHCGRMAPILPTGTAGTTCERCADARLLQKWKEQERRFKKPLVYWRENKDDETEVAIAVPPSAPVPPPPSTPPALVPTPSQESPRVKIRRQNAAKFEKKRKVIVEEPPPEPVENEPLQPPSSIFKASDEPLPDTSGMTLPQRQKALAIAAQRGCAPALAVLLDSIKHLIYKTARSIGFGKLGKSLSDEDIHDMCAEARVTLISHLDRYNPEFGWVTFSFIHIKQTCHRWCTNYGRTVRVPVCVWNTQYDISRARSKFRRENGREPTEEELRAIVKMSDKRFSNVRALSSTIESLDATLSHDDGRTKIDKLVADVDTNEATDGDYGERVHEIVATLNPRERLIIERRFGIGDEQEKTLDEVGQELGITRERVRQLELRAMLKLRSRVRRDEFGNLT